MSGAASGEPLRVLHVVLGFSPGGTERLVIELCRRMHGELSLAACCLDAPGAWAGEVEALGIPVSCLDRQPGFRPGLAVRLARIAARHRAQVLHCHHYTPFVYGALAAALTRGSPRVIYTEHGRLSAAPPSAKRRLATGLLGRIAGQFFAVSENLREHVIESGFPAARVRVIHNGIDPGPAPEPADRAGARAALGLPKEAPVVGTVARLDPVKDLETLIRGFAEARRRHPDAVLVVVGGGSEEARLREAAEAAGVAASVRFTGERSDVRALLPAFDVYANSSLTEGVSVTILEAMAAAVPVVATAVGGTPEVVVPGATGRLVPARAPEPLGEALGDLLGNPAQREALGGAGRARVLEHFTLERMAEAYFRAYRGDD